MTPGIRAMAALLGVALGLALAWPQAVHAQAAETVGLITEIKPGRGRVEVKPGAGGDWKPAGPLLALRAGDSVRASEDATAVIVLSGGRGVVRVAAASPAVLLPAAAPDDRTDRARALVESSLGFLSKTTKEAPKGLLATRGAVPPPVVLSPRASLVRAEGLTFEWVGTARGRYSVRVVGPSGPVLEQPEMTGTRLVYPEGVPALQPGARYTIEVKSAAAHPVQRAEFEVLDAERARAVARDLADIDGALGAGASPTSVAVLRAGYLAEHRLYHEARDVLLRAIRADAEQSTLYVLLGNVYERTGLAAQAAEAFEEAQWLATKGNAPARQ
jgi:hypothetical protein